MLSAANHPSGHHCFHALPRRQHPPKALAKNFDWRYQADHQIALSREVVKISGMHEHSVALDQPDSKFLA